MPLVGYAMKLSKADMKAIFINEYGEAGNFITPEILKYVFISDRMIAELSFGAGDPTSRLFNNDVWGVTVLIKKRTKWHRSTDRGQMFYSESDAWDYIAKLRKGEDTAVWHAKLKGKKPEMLSA